MNIKFIVKYVDDMFAIVKNKDLNAILTTFDKYHNKLQFTMELENDNTIAFLDINMA